MLNPENRNGGDKQGKARQGKAIRMDVLSEMAGKRGRWKSK